MTEQFEVRIYPFEHYAKQQGAEYVVFGISFEFEEDGEHLCRRKACCVETVRQMIKAADDFLTGEPGEDYRLTFNDPEVTGADDVYNYFFDVHQGAGGKDGHWTFQCCRCFWEGKPESIENKCEVSRTQISAMKAALEAQMGAFDWEEYGKTEYFRYTLPERPYEWCYSAKELESMLNRLVRGDRLQKILVSGMNYAYPLSVAENYADYYLGTRVYLEFDGGGVDMQVDAPGLVRIRVFDREEVRKTRYYGELEDPNDILCDTGYVFDNSYTGQTVTNVVVRDCNYWEYDAIGFDEGRVGVPAELPESIHFGFENSTVLSLYGANDDVVIQMEELA